MNETLLIDKCYRAFFYFKYSYGWKQRACTACAGSGYYDNNGSPQCGGCEGTGKEKYRGPKWSDDAFEKLNPKLYAESVRLKVVPKPIASAEMF